MSADRKVNVVKPDRGRRGRPVCPSHPAETMRPVAAALGDGLTWLWWTCPYECVTESLPVLPEWITPRLGPGQGA